MRAEPKKRRAGPSVYETRARNGEHPQSEPRVLAETDESTGRLRWADDWQARLTGWMPLDSFLKGRG